MPTPAPTPPLRSRLDLEWQRLATTPTSRQALSRWQQVEPALAGHDNLEQLRSTVHNRSDLTTGDRALAALVRLAAAHDDELAVRVVLQCLLPGALRLAQALSMLLGGQAASEASVLAELSIGIRTYPWQRRPHRVAANLLLDVRQRLTRAEHRWSGLVPAGLFLDQSLEPAGTAAFEDTLTWIDTRVDVDRLLRQARRNEIISPAQEQLLRDHYLRGIPIERLAGRYGRSRSTLFRDKAGAEQQLRRAAAAGHTGADLPHRPGRRHDVAVAGPAPMSRRAGPAHQVSTPDSRDYETVGPGATSHLRKERR